MVRSGLNLEPEQLREIRVSPYRLATHLSMAFTTYSVLLWTGILPMARIDNRCLWHFVSDIKSYKLRILFADYIIS